MYEQVPYKYYIPKECELGLILEEMGYSRLKILTTNGDTIYAVIRGKMKQAYKNSKKRCRPKDYILYKKLSTDDKVIVEHKLAPLELDYCKKHIHNFKEDELFL